MNKQQLHEAKRLSRLLHKTRSQIDTLLSEIDKEVYEELKKKEIKE